MCCFFFLSKNVTENLDGCGSQKRLYKHLIIPIVAVVVLIFIFGIYAGATKTFPYNIIKSVKDDLDSDLSNVKASVISNFDAGSLININEENDVYQKRQALIQSIWKTDQLPQNVPTDITAKINDPLFENLDNDFVYKNTF